MTLRIILILATTATVAITALNAASGIGLA